MVEIKNKLKHFFTHDTASKGIALLFALALWFYVGFQNPETDKIYRNVTVHVENESGSGLDIVNDPALRVEVVARGRKTQLASVYSSDIYAYIDISNFKIPGEYSVPVVVSMPAAVTSEQINPPYITVRLDKIVTKQVPVQVKVDSQLPDDYLLASTEVSPETIEVKGPEEEVAKIDHAGATISLQGERSSYSVQTGYSFFDENGTQLTLSSSTKYSTKQLDVNLTILKQKSVPLNVKYINDIYGGAATVLSVIEPESILVAGSEEVIDKLTSLDIGTVDISKIDGSQIFTFEISVPEGVRNVSKIDSAQVTVTVRSDIVRYVTADQFQIVNVPEGMTADMVTESLEIGLKGAGEAVNSVLSSQIHMEIDLSNVQATAGEYDVPVNVEIRGAENVAVSGTYNARVRLTEQVENQPEP